MNNGDYVDDPLFALELEVARRADELSRKPGLDRRSALELWCEAERELLDRVNAGVAQGAPSARLSR